MPTKKAEERIKQLCCLGLDGEVIMPTLLKELHAVVPSYSNLFHWADENCQATNLCFEDPINVDIGPLYFSEFYQKRESEVTLTFPEFVRRYRGVVTLESYKKMGLKEFYKHDYYNLIFRPINAYHCLYSILYERDRPVGVVVPTRSLCLSNWCSFRNNFPYPSDNSIFACCWSADYPTPKSASN